MAGTQKLEGKQLALSKKLLFKVAEILDTHDIPYHLEGGTLLGIVRDGQLLPWDDDLDISIPGQYREKAQEVLKKMWWSGWRIKMKRATGDTDAWHQGEVIIVKIKNRHPLMPLLPGGVQLDIFFKYNFDGHSYWQAGDKLMRVDAAYYQGYDEVEFEGHKLKAPKNCESYLEEKYGDWRTPVKDWTFHQEKTIVSQTARASKAKRI